MKEIWEQGGTKEMFSVENFIAGLGKVLRNARIEDKETHFTLIKIYGRPDSEETEEMEVGELKKEELLECSQWYSSKVNFNGSSLYNAETCESAIKPQDRGRGMPYRYYERNIYNVSERGYEMIISRASIYYVYALLCYIGISETLDVDIDFFMLIVPLGWVEYIKWRIWQRLFIY